MKVMWFDNRWSLYGDVIAFCSVLNFELKTSARLQRIVFVQESYDLLMMDISSLIAYDEYLYNELSRSRNKCKYKKLMIYYDNETEHLITYLEFNEEVIFVPRENLMSALFKEALDWEKTEVYYFPGELDIRCVSDDYFRIDLKNVKKIPTMNIIEHIINNISLEIINRGVIQELERKLEKQKHHKIK